MNAINVIAPYKHLGMWGLRRSPRRPKPRAVRGGRGRNDRSSGRRYSERRAWLHADSPPRPSPVTSTSSTWYVLMRTAVTGIVARTWIWRAALSGAVSIFRPSAEANLCAGKGAGRLILVRSHGGRTSRSPFAVAAQAFAPVSHFRGVGSNLTLYLRGLLIIASQLVQKRFPKRRHGGVPT